jgi:hypothetical protein
MTATKTLRFDGYLLEPAEFKHKALAESWTAWDKDHAGRVDPRFWLEQDERTDSYLVSDAAGPVLFFKVIVMGIKQFESDPFPSWKHAELHMQFMPAACGADHNRIADALFKGYPWLELILIGAGVSEIYFDSRSPGLVAFTTKRMGFTQEGGRLRKRLELSAAAPK